MWHHPNVSKITIILLICVCRRDAKILRNNALMEKMVSNFHSRDNTASPEMKDKEEYQPEELREQPTEPLDPQDQGEQKQPKIHRFYAPDQEPIQEKPKEQSNVLVLMQKVLCKNFPTIPCDIITKDDTLKRLIQKSVSQIKNKQFQKNPLFGTHTQSPIGHLTFFPVVDSEDLSNFLLVRDPTNLFTTKSTDPETPPKKHKKKRKKKSEDGRRRKSRKKQILNTKDTDSVIEVSRKKIHKFYPHKLKGSATHAEKHSLPTYSEERTSMSVEVPDTGVIRKRRLPIHEDEDYSSVWRIDYLKHGDPSIARINHNNDYFQNKITKTGDNVIVDENLEPASRRDVLHPDIYIKKNYGKQSQTTIL